MMRNGLCYRLPNLERHIGDAASLLWRTPQAQDHKSGKTQQGYQTNLVHQVLYPTPTAESSGRNKSKSPNAKVRPSLAMMARQKLLTREVQGHLNPAWVEVLMGFPPGWTDITNGQPD
jgi:hypothetical protein